MTTADRKEFNWNIVESGIKYYFKVLAQRAKQSEDRHGTPLELESTIDHTWIDHANHYTTNIIYIDYLSYNL
jgi:hypothetical protein